MRACILQIDVDHLLQQLTETQALDESFLFTQMASANRSGMQDIAMQQQQPFPQSAANTATGVNLMTGQDLTGYNLTPPTPVFASQAQP
jgi:hypothetical protein